MHERLHNVCGFHTLPPESLVPQHGVEDTENFTQRTAYLRRVGFVATPPPALRMARPQGREDPIVRARGIHHSIAGDRAVETPPAAVSVCSTHALRDFLRAVPVAVHEARKVVHPLNVKRGVERARLSFLSATASHRAVGAIGCDHGAVAL